MKKKVFLKKSERAALLEDLLRGETPRSLAKKYAVGISTVYRVLRERHGKTVLSAARRVNGSGQGHERTAEEARLLGLVKGLLGLLLEKEPEKAAEFLVDNYDKF